MKKLSLFFALILVSISFCAKAHDFYSINSYGDTIYYNITSTSFPYTVEVTFKGNQYTINNIYYSDTISIPSSVMYNGIQYSVTSIGYNAFSYNDNLTDVEIPSSVKYIGPYAFCSCNGLKVFTIPIDIDSVGIFVFSGCSRLKTINFNARNCYEMRFEATYADSLTTVNIGDSVKIIPDLSFSNCDHLTYVNMGNSVEVIGYNAFTDCFNLRSITIPTSVDSVADGGFSLCNGLLTVNYNARNCKTNSMFSAINSITTVNIGSEVEKIPGLTFMCCGGLMTVNFFNSSCIIGPQAFLDCYALSNLNLGDSVTIIDSSAFLNCYGLTNLTIPNSVTKLNQAAFYNCNGLTSIISFVATPPLIDTFTFLGVNHNIPIYVPCNSVSQYQSAQYWSNFTNIQGIGITTNIIDSVAQGNTYNQYGFNETTAGVYTQNLQTINGCDSTVTLTLSVYTLTTPASFVMQNNQDYIELSWQGNGNRYEIIRNNVFLASVTETTYQDNDVISGNTYCYQIRAYADNISSELSPETCQTFLNLNDIEDSQIKANLYPNPTSEKTTLELQGLKSDANVFIYDIMGKAIKTYKINANQKSLEINLNDFTSGIYNIRIINSDFNITKKLIVK